MTTCRVCGDEVRTADDTIDVNGDRLHAGCTEAHKAPRRRKIGLWAAMGSRGQMAMGAVQRPD